jgi:hypothetical protein
MGFSFNRKVLNDQMMILKYIFLYTSLLTSVLSTSLLFYLYIENGVLLLERIILLPLFIVSTFIVLAHSLTSYSLAEESYNARYFKIWSISSGSILFIILTFFIYNNYSKDILVAEFYWDSGITLKFKENGKFRAENSEWVAGSVSYGRYSIQESMIILHDNVKFGNANIMDTLSLSTDSMHLIFRLESEWEGIEGGEMSIKKDHVFRKQ